VQASWSPPLPHRLARAKSAPKRARNKKSAAANTAATQPAGAARSHEHSHDGGGHSHSRGGLPCGGHGSDGLSLSGGSVSSEDLSEAVHYTDVLWHFQSYATHSFQRLERMHSDFTSSPTSSPCCCCCSRSDGRREEEKSAQ
jgi:hypothetical protein